MNGPGKPGSPRGSAGPDTKALGRFLLVSGSRTFPIGSKVELALSGGTLEVRSGDRLDIYTLENLSAVDEDREDAELDYTSRLPKVLRTWGGRWTSFSLLMPRTRFLRRRYLVLRSADPEELVELRALGTGAAAKVIHRWQEQAHVDPSPKHTA